MQRRKRRQRNRENNAGKLKLVVKSARRDAISSVALRIDGQLTFDRRSWSSGAQKFGQRRFGNVDNSLRTQMERLQKLWEKCSSSSSSVDCVNLEPWHVIEARSRLGTGAAGPDGIPPQVWKSVPFIFVLRIFDMFVQYARFDSTLSTPTFWRQLAFIGIPKDKKTAELFEDLRWIGLTPTLQKWYLRSLRPGLRARIHRSPVHTYGFKPHRSCSEILALVRQTIHLANVWGLPLYIAAQDVLTAFDAMDHDMCVESYIRRGSGFGYAYLLARELTAVQGRMRVPGAETSLPFDFQRGGKQGGVDTPDNFNIYLEEALHKVVETWALRGWGFKLDDYAISHAIWADNIIVFAGDRQQLDGMLVDLGRAISTAKLKWKTTSLQILGCGAVTNFSGTLSVKFGDFDYQYCIVRELPLLGSVFDSKGSSMTSFHHRQQRGDASYFKHRACLKHRTSWPTLADMVSWSCGRCGVQRGVLAHFRRTFAPSENMGIGALEGHALFEAAAGRGQMWLQSSNGGHD